MNPKRRDTLRLMAVIGLMASTGLISQAQAAEWNEVSLNAPDIAENGAVVPVGVSTSLKAQQIAILVEKNPNVLAAHFTLPAGTEPFVGTRVKMGQTSNVMALVKADGKWFVTSKEVKVTLGGCGG